MIPKKLIVIRISYAALQANVTHVIDFKTKL
jgi:hypothetical protein